MADEDLKNIHDYLSARTTPKVASSYIEDIVTYCENFSIFPLRGRIRDDLRSGLRIVGYKRRASIAFIVRDKQIIILRIFHRGMNISI